MLSDTYYIGVGAADGRKLVTPDPAADFLGGIAHAGGPDRRYELPGGADDVARTFGARVYRAMLVDPAVSSAFNSLRLSILDGGIHFKPSHDIPESLRAPKPTAKAPVKPVEKKEPEAPKPSMTPEQARSVEICDFVKRRFDAVWDMLYPELFSLLQAMAFGVKLGETTLAPVAHGIDGGKLGIGTFKVKPDWAWRFVVDRAMNVKGILSCGLDDGLYVMAEPKKFAWLSWMPQDGDPRGTSVLRAAYDAWNCKVQSWPDYYKFLKRFGSPGIASTLPEREPPLRPDVDEDGKDIPNSAVTPAQRMVKLLQLYQAGGVIATPFGTTVTPFEAKSDGKALVDAFDLFDRQIVLAIAMQVRASLEAKHGSKADSDTAENVKGLVVPFGRACLAACMRKVAKLLVEVNYGEEDAETFLPRISFGQAEQQDKPAIWGAVGGLWTSGYVGESQREELDAMIGLPPRDAEADAKAAADKAAQDAKLKADAGGPVPPAKGIPAKGGDK